MSSNDRRRTAALRAARKRWSPSTILTLLAVAVVAIFAVVVLGSILTQRHTTTQATGPGPPVDIGQLPGLQSSPAPWQPEYAQLPARLAALHLPPNGDESYHIHAHLAIFVDGQPVTVPANVGISAAAGLESPMHTHDTTGVIHIEASQPSSAFTLGAFLDLWGVDFTNDRLGGYHDTAGKAVHVYVNGQPITDPARYPLHPHDDIVLGYGSPDSFPHTAPFTWPDGE